MNKERIRALDQALVTMSSAMRDVPMLARLETLLGDDEDWFCRVKKRLQAQLDALTMRERANWPPPHPPQLRVRRDVLRNAFRLLEDWEKRLEDEGRDDAYTATLRETRAAVGDVFYRANRSRHYWASDDPADYGSDAHANDDPNEYEERTCHDT